MGWPWSALLPSRTTAAWLGTAIPGCEAVVETHVITAWLGTAWLKQTDPGPWKNRIWSYKKMCQGTENVVHHISYLNSKQSYVCLEIRLSGFEIDKSWMLVFPQTHRQRVFKTEK